MTRKTFKQRLLRPETEKQLYDQLLTTPNDHISSFPQPFNKPSQHKGTTRSPKAPTCTHAHLHTYTHTHMHTHTLALPSRGGTTGPFEGAAGTLEGAAGPLEGVAGLLELDEASEYGFGTRGTALLGAGTTMEESETVSLSLLTSSLLSTSLTPTALGLLFLGGGGLGAVPGVMEGEGIVGGVSSGPGTLSTRA